MKTKVLISIDNDLPMIKIDVEMDQLPLHYKNNGYEVIVDFQLKNFENNETFYTDANGLEM